MVRFTQPLSIFTSKSFLFLQLVHLSSLNVLIPILFSTMFQTSMIQETTKPIKAEESLFLSPISRKLLQSVQAKKQ